MLLFIPSTCSAHSWIQGALSKLAVVQQVDARVLSPRREPPSRRTKWRPRAPFLWVRACRSVGGSVRPSVRRLSPSLSLSLSLSVSVCLSVCVCGSRPGPQSCENSMKGRESENKAEPDTLFGPTRFGKGKQYDTNTATTQNTVNTNQCQRRFRDAQFKSTWVQFNLATKSPLTKSLLPAS